MGACSREDRAHTQLRSRVATTGRNTLKRMFDKLDVELLPQLGGAFEPKFIIHQEDVHSGGRGLERRLAGLTAREARVGP